MNFFKLYTRVLTLLGPEARLGWVLAGANVALAAAQFAEPVLFGRIIDALVKGQTAGATPTFEALTPLLAAWVAFGLFIIACGVLVALHADRLSHRRKQSVTTMYFEHVLQLPLSFHGGSHSGRLMKVMLTGVDALWTLWLSFFREHFAAFVALFVLLPLSLFVNWRLASLLLILCAVFAGLTVLVIRKTEKLQSAVEGHYTSMAERASDALSNIALVQGFARVEAEVKSLRNEADRLLAAQMPVLSWWAMIAVLTRSATTITILSIFLLGIYLNSQGQATIGEIVTFMNFAALLIVRMEQVVGFTNKVLLDAPRLKEFFDVLDTVPAVRDRADAVDPGRMRGLIEFDDVSFSYDGKRPAIADLSFTALPGETIALVGSTGAGKSTALALLHRAFDPQSGVVKIDGMDIKAVKLAALRHNIGVVYQEALLFNRSIAENLRVGNPDATDEQLLEAAARAQASELIERHPDGLDGTVGERGRSLSGGERQRISIARALLKDPPILILDEATSALDATTERKVQAALDEVMKGRTTFVIAHRLATVRNATRILVFDQGRVIEQGTFDELVARNGRFAELARAQFMAPPQPVPQEAPAMSPAAE
ncbi:MAG: ATP-binding cassette, subfamily beta-glucan exporter [Hyphomicrobiales bacterium]|jgi:ATP-binding cassette subfamily B protein|nr:ATP-binding cassette, subfamily beta-glucan exporter [Hyphomicrobiales bacterium]